MGKFIIWLEENKTRLRLFAGASVVLLFILIVLVFLIALFFDFDLEKNGGMLLLGAVTTAMFTTIGAHMATSPKDTK